MRMVLRAILIVALLVGTSAPAGATVNWTTFFNLGCALTDSPIHGCAFTGAKGPVAPGELGRGSKTGEACGWSFLALFARGDMRITTAMKNGGITKISSIDKRVVEVVPGFYIFGRYCTVVTGE